MCLLALLIMTGQESLTAVSRLCVMLPGAAANACMIPDPSSVLSLLDSAIFPEGWLIRQWELVKNLVHTQVLG